MMMRRRCRLLYVVLIGLLLLYLGNSYLKQPENPASQATQNVQTSALDDPREKHRSNAQGQVLETWSPKLSTSASGEPLIHSDQTNEKRLVNQERPYQDQFRPNREWGDESLKSHDEEEQERDLDHAIQEDSGRGLLSKEQQIKLEHNASLQDHPTGNLVPQRNMKGQFNDEENMRKRTAKERILPENPNEKQLMKDTHGPGVLDQEHAIIDYERPEINFKEQSAKDHLKPQIPLKHQFAADRFEQALPMNEQMIIGQSRLNQLRPRTHIKGPLFRENIKPKLFMKENLAPEAEVQMITDGPAPEVAFNDRSIKEHPVPEVAMKEHPGGEYSRLYSDGNLKTRENLEHNDVVQTEARTPQGEQLHSRQHEARMWKFRKATTEIQQVIFAKVHKAASSTVQNIMLRFALARNLSLLLPDIPPIIDDRSSRVRNIVPHPDGAGKPFDILCNHVIFNEAVLSNYFRDSAVRVAIIREPLGQTLSALAYYTSRFPTFALKQGFMKFRDDPINGFLNNPELFYNPYANEGPALSYINNRMSMDLGFDLTDLDQGKKNETKIDAFLEQLENQFDLILISDYFDESMVLLRRYLSWSMKDILYIRRNSAQFGPNSVWRKSPVLSPTTSKIFRQWDYIDNRLYEHFFPIFLQKIQQEHLFQEEVNEYQRIKTGVKDFCKKHYNTKTVLKVPQGSWSEEFYVTPRDCRHMFKSEVQFVWEARKLQLERYQQHYRRNRLGMAQ